MKRIAFASRSSTLLLTVGWVLAACGGRPATPVPPAEVAPEVRQALTAAMHESAAAWNRGDLDTFLAVYRDDARTAFMARQITYGLADIKARYARSYFKDGQPKAQLTYDDLVFRPLGPDYVLMTGKWFLTDPDGKRQDGFYTLVWERTPAGWRIIHDHSS